MPVSMSAAEPAFAEGECALVDHLADDAREDSDRRGLHARGSQPEVCEHPLARLAGHLDECQRRERVERLVLHGAAESIDDDLSPAAAAASAGDGGELP